MPVAQEDPFRHHPTLRALVNPRADSFFADFETEKVRAVMRENGLAMDWITPDKDREADRARVLAGRMDQDLWVFGYGSLMWDPGMAFTEVRRAWMPGVGRRFILYDSRGARGTEEKPGLMAALDAGDGCHGLVFRIDARALERESYSLWARERIGPAYHAEFRQAETAHGTVEALCFLANHDAEQIRGDLTHDQQVTMIATGAGFLGTSLAYIEGLAEHLHEFGIEDPEVQRLLQEARARAAT